MIFTTKKETSCLRGMADYLTLYKSWIGVANKGQTEPPSKRADGPGRRGHYKLLLVELVVFSLCVTIGSTTASKESSVSHAFWEA